MVKREKWKTKVEENEEEEEGIEEMRGSTSAAGQSEDDDEEANEDLTLKIVEKAMLSRVAVKLAQGGNGVVLDENVVSPLKSKRKKKKKKKKRNQNAEDGDRSVEESVETVEKSEAAEVADFDQPGNGDTKSVEAAELVVEHPDGNTDEVHDNAVLRKLLRGPRYFDPPDGGWGTCYNCGEEGHMAVNCPSLERRKKPCFVCGDLDHQGKQCPKGKDCYICKKGGHRAKDCPDKGNGLFNNSKICLKCCESGHDLFSCRKDYCPDDLKEIQCYVCKSFGHLCCLKFVDNSPTVISCYQCGEQGHNGLACFRVREEDANGTPSSCYKCGEGGHFARECANTAKACFRVWEEDTNGTTSSCYKCGEGGHFARECTNNAKACSRVREEDANGMPSSCYKCGEGGHFARECTSAAKGNCESSTSALRDHKRRNKLGSKSAPQEFGKTRQKKKVKYEEKGNLTPQKLKKRGGWIQQDHGDSDELIPKEYDIKSPSMPSSHYTFSHSSYGNKGSSARSSKIIHASNPETSVVSQRLGTAYQQGFSATRFSFPGATHGGAGRMYGNPSVAFQYPAAGFGNSSSGGMHGHPGRTYGHPSRTYRQPVHTYGDPGEYHPPGAMHGTGSGFGNAYGMYGNRSNGWIRRNNWSHGNNYQRF